ncbi:phospho-N-acetylmuramoyl-pentapeptide-transferase [Tyzzerella sp. An114]|uniref:phospho-N-acetylmuramoyl-pentapeptide- transferase n=1 Tax=Tyzzerella sp. An114 TaxID=1965545 RepID=UPI000B44E5B2|nr:phospho-N-acetylmuramoyl-pentapeptide-transferase [Tyzzerella sp. An114]OUQ59931.1 phospho-N-acetylmuramoyl-pentapeptide-transferase [Tyzzerella sp. An114]
MVVTTLEIAVYSVMISFILGIVFCPMLIPVLRRLKFGQTEREEGPESHLKKQGTPTMGGIAILAAFVMGGAFFINGNMDGLAVLLVTLGFGVIGFIDDYIKVVKKRSLGLTPIQKIIGQLVITGLFAFYIIKSGIGTDIFIPFTKGVTIDLGIIYIPFLVVTVLGTVNGVNLTDGLDGLASGVTLIVSVFFMMVAWAAGSGILPIAGAAGGSLLAFLIFNAYPAKVFMGDTGSLALGGFVASTALILKMPIFIIIVGFIYLMESISVILQVAYFKKTGKRIFKMAPIHHHFELCGWSETKVVTVFYIITAMLCLVGLLACKYMFM